jgi:hypothetical protein
MNDGKCHEEGSLEVHAEDRIHAGYFSIVLCRFFRCLDPIFLQLRLMCLPMTVDDMDDVSPKWCSVKQRAEFVSSMRL